MSRLKNIFFSIVLIGVLSFSSTFYTQAAVISFRMPDSSQSFYVGDVAVTICTGFTGNKGYANFSANAYVDVQMKIVITCGDASSAITLDRSFSESSGSEVVYTTSKTISSIETYYTIYTADGTEVQKYLYAK